MRRSLIKSSATVLKVGLLSTAMKSMNIVFIFFFVTVRRWRGGILRALQGSRLHPLRVGAGGADH